MVDAAQSGVPVPGVMSSIRAMATRVHAMERQRFGQEQEQHRNEIRA